MLDAARPAIDWLLEPEHPSIRYRALVELLRRSVTDREAATARAAIPASTDVQRILAAMHPDGYWLQRQHDGRIVGEGVEYGSFASTHFCLAYLAELGLDRGNPLVARAAERYLALQAPDGDFWRHLSCLLGYNIRTFLRLGYRGDPRLERSIDLLERSGRADGGYLCEIHEGRRGRRFVHSCARGSAKALAAYAELPDRWSSPACLALVGYFLRRDGVFRTRAPQTPVTRESTLTVFPFTWGCGLLDVLGALATMGYGTRPELDRAWAILDGHRDDDGRYRLDWTATQAALPAGARGAASKWVTLYALLALDRREHAALV
ncbi:MAG TPA: hypothetical protein VIR16_07440 [Candidatus Limnocylindrales bacterium]